MTTVGGRLKHAWNAFVSENQSQATRVPREYGGSVGGGRQDRPRSYMSSERSIIASIYARLAIDVAQVELHHCRVDDERRFLEDIDSGLNNCLTVEANLDQAARAFRQDIAHTVFEKGVAAIVPVDTSLSPLTSGGYNILTMRVGDVVQWYPKHVRVDLYNETTGTRQEVTLPKSMVAIVENPLYSVMNEPNSTLQRLIRKLNMLDAVDEQSASGKLDIIVQVPYAIKSESRRTQAAQRRKDLEFQLKDSKYGIGQIDATEKITQLNRPAENNLMAQVEYLTDMLYGQLGLTEEIMNGTADEKTMINYWNRTIEPVLTTVAEAMRRSFLTKTARSQMQSILFFKDPFRLAAIGDIAEIADKFTRNEILSANEIRSVVGFKPSDEPKANQLVNSNMPQSDTGVAPPGGADPAAENQLNSDLAEFGVGVTDAAA
ncbi:MAG TPA: phage portal protein [Nitrospira sp.]|nr:phage portal protein [Nitrospira sp.]